MFNDVQYKTEEGKEIETFKLLKEQNGVVLRVISTGAADSLIRESGNTKMN